MEGKAKLNFNVVGEVTAKMVCEDEQLEENKGFSKHHSKNWGHPEGEKIGKCNSIKFFFHQLCHEVSITSK